METLFLVFVIILFILAFSDLIVGVSNDAVNFLNSAIGSKVATKRTIFLIASAGIILGATFSSGMMEVARKGIFHPEMFTFSQVMIIFLAVMLTDVILLDLFNTYAMPTSTTVSIVFELLGSAVAVGLIALNLQSDASLHLGDYINTGSALTIVSGILLSIIIAFTLGAIVQYFVRLIFTFDYEKNLKYFGSVFGGIAITAITYFILIKGAKGASFLTDDIQLAIRQNAGLIILVSFIVWTLLLQVGISFFKLKVTHLIVLVGTFALAMAFAGNDLVNFIGVPMAGLKSFQEFTSAVAANADTFMMEVLSKSVKTETWMLLIAGIVMTATLWMSKKAHSVTQTEINLARQSEGYERFKSAKLSRWLVRSSTMISQAVNRFLPKKVVGFIDKRFQQTQSSSTSKSAPAFDTLRASVNLTVASIIISFATSLKLPLSTTYVTFMVAMGTSLADKAWGRESAVYRITGVLSVIGGWFLTAIIAFTASFLIANFLFYGGILAVIVMAIVAAVFIIRTQRIHKSRSIKQQQLEDDYYDQKLTEQQNALIRSNRVILSTLINSSRIYFDIIKAVSEDNRNHLRLVQKEIALLNNGISRSNGRLYGIIQQLEEKDLESGQSYIQSLDYVRELVRSLESIFDQSFHHINNNHKGFTEIQIEELNRLGRLLSDYHFEVTEMIKKHNYPEVDNLLKKNKELNLVIEDLRKNQIKRIKHEKDKTKRSMLFLSILFETKNILRDSESLLLVQEQFINRIDSNRELANYPLYQE